MFVNYIYDYRYSCFRKAQKPRLMTMEARCREVLFPNHSKEKSVGDTLVPPFWGKRGILIYLFLLFARATARGGTCAFTFENSQHADQKQLTRRQAFDLDLGSTHRLPTSCWA